MFDNILLAVDGSEHALHAARVAGDLARATEAQTLRVIVVYDPVPPNLGEPNFSQAIASRKQEARDIVERSTQEVGEVPGEISIEIIEGQIADKIVDVASIRKSDVIVMGSRGRTGLASALLGSNSQKVVSHAPCPVLIVR